MATLVSASWAQEHIETPGFLLLDPRRPMKYMLGHLKGAVNLPLYKAFDSEARLLSPAALASWIGKAGLGDDVVPVIYDSYDGQNGAMLTWVLEYLGRTDVHMMDLFFEGWRGEGREVFYRPVAPTPRHFTTKTKSRLRATRGLVSKGGGGKLVDFRSPEEYTGQLDAGGLGGHIPGAVNLVWKDLVGSDDNYLASKESLERLVARLGLSPGDEVVAYCNTGPRASVGYLALSQLGYKVRLYDGSFKDWTSHGLPIE